MHYAAVCSEERAARSAQHAARSTQCAARSAQHVVRRTQDAAHSAHNTPCVAYPHKESELPRAGGHADPLAERVADEPADEPPAEEPPAEEPPVSAQEEVTEEAEAVRRGHSIPGAGAILEDRLCGGSEFMRRSVGYTASPW